ncbi:MULTISPECIES: helix-turn-helix domain-containing protein [Rhodanobacter]|uniref:helix-turn-helix domain-containing protein n=1 Tax=Rhodanobacter TaxID=75309 RepID=UPI00055BFB85|nr:MULTISPECIES: helix-turn-helix transcriptional regulator [Rhodanobacter]TAN18784.1 MAG: XRE family transcriptional regulator [Rhodanobacter sp.]UJJ55021.1 helix-turn-helix domain-containing protein [Rhodanobacter thiooxydans]
MLDNIVVDVDNKFSERLRAEREKRGLTQPAAAGHLGIPLATYRSYESGRSEPPISLLAKMMAAGMDGMFVAVGRSLNELTSESIDWALLSEITQILHDWSSSRPRPLDADELARFMRTSYLWAARMGRQAGLDLLAELRAA